MQSVATTVCNHWLTCGQPVVANSAQLVNLESVAESEKNPFVIAG